ncbi:MAG: nucleotide-binding universal stress UspA family protein [Saprospiraceae bacterium]|jgi:nucleotide-binding universal stress UspA family protein
MKNILVGINHSNHTPILLRYALKIAQYFRADLTAAHIIKPGNFEVTDVDLMDSKLTREEIRLKIEKHKLKAEVRLDEVLQRSFGKEYSDLNINSIVELGTPSEQLSKIAREIPADVLVLTSQNENQFSDWLVGDMVTNTLEKATCPVLLIPAYVKYHGINRIVYSTNFSFSDLEALFFLKKWSEAFKTKLVAVHVCNKDESEENATRKMKVLKQVFPTLETHLLHGHPVNAIDDYLTLTQADLVATTMRDRTFWQSVFEPSVTKEIVKDVLVPMLIFKEKK